MVSNDKSDGMDQVFRMRMARAETVQTSHSLDDPAIIRLEILKSGLGNLYSIEGLSRTKILVLCARAIESIAEEMMDTPDVD